MSDATPMSSTRPYLIRAMYDWIVDNRCTPHLLVDAKDPQVRVPRQFVDKGVIVLNVSPTAVKNLVLGLDNITFSARFSGTPHDIDVPVPAVQAIYAHHVLHAFDLAEIGGVQQDALSLGSDHLPEGVEGLSTETLHVHEVHDHLDLLLNGEMAEGLVTQVL